MSDGSARSTTTANKLLASSPCRAAGTRLYGEDTAQLIDSEIRDPDDAHNTGPRYPDLERTRSTR